MSQGDGLAIVYNLCDQMDMTQAAVRRFRLLPEALPAAELRVQNRQVVPYVLILAVFLLLSTFLGYRSGSFSSAVPGVVGSALILTYVFFVVPRRTRKVLARCWDTYTLEIGPDYLLRQQADTPDVRLSFSEIKRIEQRPEAVRVIGTKKLHVIGIPKGIERFDEVWQTVSGLAPVSNHRSDRAVWRHVITVLFCAAFLGMLWSSSPQIVLPLAAAMIVLLVWGIVVLRRSPNISRAARRSAWVYAWIMFLVCLKVMTILPQLIRH